MTMKAIDIDDVKNLNQNEFMKKYAELDFGTAANLFQLMHAFLHKNDDVLGQLLLELEQRMHVNVIAITRSDVYNMLCSQHGTKKVNDLVLSVSIEDWTTTIYHAIDRWQEEIGLLRTYIIRAAATAFEDDRNRDEYRRIIDAPEKMH
jgi:hypothetical protein